MKEGAILEGFMKFFTSTKVSEETSKALEVETWMREAIMEDITLDKVKR